MILRQASCNLVGHWNIFNDVLRRLRSLSKSVVASARAKMEITPDMNDCRFVSFESNVSYECSMRRSQVSQISESQMLVINKRRMNPRARRMIDAKVVHLRISPEQIALLMEIIVSILSRY